MIKTSLIIPTYNEAKNIEILVEEIFSVIDRTKIDLSVIIVDDNSPDGTGEVAERLGAKYPVQVLHRSGKLGLGGAVREGFERADSDIVGVMDGDLSHDPIVINNLILYLNDFDVTIGSRFEVESGVEWNWRRKLIAHSGALLARRLTGTKDPLSGYFFIHKRVIDQVNLTTVGYKILLEILIKGNYKKIKEVPYTFRYRRFSVSKLNYKEYLLFIGQLLKYSLYKIYKLIFKI